MVKETAVKEEKPKEVEDAVYGFELDPDEINVRFNMQVESGADITNYPVIHRLSRLPNNEERIAIAQQEYLQETIKGETKHTGDRNKVIAEIWENSIVSVEGYSANGKDLRLEDPIPENLKKRMPVSHRVSAIGNLEMIRNYEDGETIRELNAATAFNLTGSDVVEITLERGDDRFLIRHVFSEINPLELTKSQVRVVEQHKGNRTFYRLGSMNKVEKFYDDHIQRVEGYVLRGQDLIKASPKGWEKHIPIDHKMTAIIRLQKRFGDEAKN